MKDPARLLDRDGTPEELALLRAADAEAPTLADRAALFSALGLPAPTVPPALPKVALKITGGSLKASALKLATVGLAAGVAALGVLKLQSAAPPPPATTAVVRSTAQGEAPHANVPAEPSSRAIVTSTLNEEPSTTHVAASASRSARAAKKTSRSIAGEIELLDAARRDLGRSDVVGARATLDRYAREYPSGELLQEARELRAEMTRQSRIRP